MLSKQVYLTFTRPSILSENFSHTRKNFNLEIFCFNSLKVFKLFDMFQGSLFVSFWEKLADIFIALGGGKWPQELSVGRVLSSPPSLASGCKDGTHSADGGHGRWRAVLVLPGPFQILGQQYHRSEYHFHKILRQAKLFIRRDSLCTRKKSGKKVPALQVQGASCFYDKRESLSHDHW